MSKKINFDDFLADDPDWESPKSKPKAVPKPVVPIVPKRKVSVKPKVKRPAKKITPPNLKPLPKGPSAPGCRSWGGRQKILMIKGDSIPKLESFTPEDYNQMLLELEYTPREFGRTTDQWEKLHYVISDRKRRIYFDHGMDLYIAYCESLKPGYLISPSDFWMVIEKGTFTKNLSVDGWSLDKLKHLMKGDINGDLWTMIRASNGYYQQTIERSNKPAK